MPHCFWYRGPLPPEHPNFQGRLQEFETLYDLCQGELRSYLIIFGGRQTGKTSFFYHVPQYLGPQFLVCHIDFQSLTDATIEHVYGYILNCLEHSIGQNDSTLVEVNSVQLSEKISKLLNEIRHDKLVFLFEELGALSKGVRHALANLLRSWFTGRFSPRNQVFKRLMVVVAGNVELYELAAVDNSPFRNICECLYLPDLSLQETTSLMINCLSHYSFSGNKPEQIAQLVFDTFGGHPYLVQRVGGYIEEILSKREEISSEIILQLENLLISRESFISHLLKALNELQLWPFVPAILSDQIKFSRNDREMSLLELLGLATEQDGYWKIRNRFFVKMLRSKLGETHSPDHHVYPLEPAWVDYRLQIVNPMRSVFTISAEAKHFGESQENFSPPYTTEEMIAILKAIRYPSLLCNSEDFSPKQLQILNEMSLLINDHFIGKENMLALVGRQLYNSLFPGRVNTTFQAIQQQARIDKKVIGLQLRMSPDVVDFARYPWELLHTEYGPLLAGGTVELTRYITYPQTVPSLENISSWRMLYITSRPQDQQLGFLTQNEHLSIIQSLKSSLDSQKLVIDSLLPSTYDELLSKLELTEYHIIHFDGHGIFARKCEICGGMNYPHLSECASCRGNIAGTKARGYLAFETLNGKVDWVDQSALTNALAGNKIQLVVISACDSSQVRDESIFFGVGPALVRAGIPAVVAMQMPIKMSSAINFSKGFYAALTEGKSIPKAVAQGRKRLFRSYDYFIPTLYMRSDNDKTQPLSNHKEGKNEQ